ncbi:MAG: protein kinase [Candidatus Solibacter sp.]
MKLTEDIALNDTATLAQRMAEGRLPVPEALRYAMQLAEAVRKLHDSGRWHGALSPSNLGINPTSLELLAPPEGSTRMVTPYTAPEVIQGSPADNLSDIFSFGAIVFELMTGRRAFNGDSRAALASHITKGATPTSGSPAVDRLLGPCMAKNPDSRTPRVQKIMLELKLLSVAARRVGQVTPISLQREGPSPDNALARAEMQQLEAKLAARLQLHERTIAEMHRSASDSVTNLKLQMATLNSNVALGRPSPLDRLDDSVADGSIQARIDRGFDVLNARMATMERAVEEMRRKSVQFEHNIAADLVDIEHGLKLQSAAIESARTAMSQTDDLVERVVEALESLQTSVLDQDETSLEHASFAIN